MENGPYREANRHSDIQGLPRILWYSKVHYCTRTLHLSISCASSIKSRTSSQYLKINFNIILPSVSPSVRFPQHSPVHLSTPPMHVTCPTRLLRDA